jgi:hypothetical protein
MDQNQLSAILAVLQNQNQQQPQQTPGMSADDARTQALLNGNHMQWGASDRELVRKNILEALKGM